MCKGNNLLKFSFYIFTILSITKCLFSAEFIEYPGHSTKSKKIVLLSGDQEYRSEEALPQLARILTKHHGYHCMILFVQDPEHPGIVDPEYAKHVPGLDALKTADLFILSTRFLDLPDGQMQIIDDYLKSGRPVLGLRASNHGFRIDSNSKWAHYDWQYEGSKSEWHGGFGQMVFGGKFIDHHGKKNHESTLGIFHSQQIKHPILNGIEDKTIWGPTFVYGVNVPLRKDCNALVYAQVLDGMTIDSPPLGPGPYSYHKKRPLSLSPSAKGKNDPMMPLAWTTKYQLPGGQPGQAFHTTMGASQDLLSNSTRRMVINAAKWLLGNTPPKEGSKVTLVGDYQATDFGFHRGDAWQKRGLRVDSFNYDFQSTETSTKTLNLADPNLHPYADTQKSRSQHRFSSHRVNSERLYDFYSRQADYYMKHREVEGPLPAYPGLDGGSFGHWGKYSQNQFVDNQWNKMDLGPVQSHWLKFNQAEYHPAISSRIGDQQELVAHFDPKSASYPTIWSGEFLTFSGARWGMHAPAAPKGKLIFENQRVAAKINRRPPPLLKMPHEINYLGHHRWGKTVVHRYTLDGIDIKDRPWAKENIFYRTLEWNGNNKPLRILICQIPDDKSISVKKNLASFDIGEYKATVMLRSLKTNTAVSLEVEDGLLWANLTGRGDSSAQILRWVNQTDDTSNTIHQLSLDDLPQGPKTLYPTPLITTSTLAENTNAYVVDDVEIPFQNPWKSRMFLSSIAFKSNGDAFVTTMMGEIWRITGLHENMSEIKWHRYATGLEQPLGIVIDNDEIFVMCRTQIAQIHDINKDGEADYIECHTPLQYSYPCMAGLSLDQQGYFWFVNGRGSYRVPKDKSSGPEIIADGMRNPLASGMDSEGNFYAGPQEGIITPTSFVAECRPGEFYGFNSRRFGQESISVPMVYVPRGIDNSTGGFVVNSDKRFGPLANTLIGMSFGNSQLYAILRDRQNPKRTQGAVVPLEGMTSSGICRGAVNPKDGQLYVVGLNGWGDYAIADGCLHRYRYTGKEHYHAIDFSLHSNGIKILFNEKLERQTAEMTHNYFAQKWGYKYSRGYGCHETSIEKPESLGHDKVLITQVRLLDDGKSIFVEIPNLKPAMVQYLRMHLRTKDGTDFKTDLFTTIAELPQAFELEGLSPLVAGKPQRLTLPIDTETGKFHGKEMIGKVKVDKTLQVDAVPGLAFSTESITAKAGQTLGLRFTNTDQMPHNLVIIAPGTYDDVVKGSKEMIAEPNAADKNYVPDTAKVIAQTPMVQPDTEYDLIFKAPKEPGKYPYLCTFPGHWLLMKGELIIEPNHDM